MRRVRTITGVRAPDLLALADLAPRPPTAEERLARESSVLLAGNPLERVLAMLRRSAARPESHPEWAHTGFGRCYSVHVTALANVAVADLDRARDGGWMCTDPRDPGRRVLLREDA